VSYHTKIFSRLNHLAVIILGFWLSTAYAASTNELNSRTQQLQTEHRLDQVRQDLKAQSSSNIPSYSGQGYDFAPSLPGFYPTARVSGRLSPEQMSQYLEQLGDPIEETGVYSYPREMRLFYYGQMCIKVGLIEEGIRAISEHMRIQAEAAATIR
jgi:hypothetical protein